MLLLQLPAIILWKAIVLLGLYLRRSGYGTSQQLPDNGAAKLLILWLRKATILFLTLFLWKIIVLLKLLTLFLWKIKILAK